MEHLPVTMTEHFNAMDDIHLMHVTETFHHFFQSNSPALILLSMNFELSDSIVIQKWDLYNYRDGLPNIKMPVVHTQTGLQ